MPASPVQDGKGSKRVFILAPSRIFCTLLWGEFFVLGNPPNASCLCACQNGRVLIRISLARFIEPFHECNPLRFLDGIRDVDQ